MRLTDAEKLMQMIPTEEYNARMVIANAPTVDAVPLEDYKSMERTVDKLTKAITEAEPTEEQVERYCRERCLVIVTSELFNEMKARWSAEPVVRCKDCRYYQSDGEWYDDDVCKVHPDDDNGYCAWGERREDAERMDS